MIQSLVVILIPLISKIQELNTRWGVQYDIFFFWKDKVLWFFSFLLLFFLKKNSKLIIAYLWFLFLSTLFSNDLALTIWGFPNYSEGAVTLFCYCVLFLSAYNYTEEGFLNAAKVSIICLFLFCIIHLLYSNFLLFPPLLYLSGLNEYRESLSAIRLPLYVSLANPNHLGLYCALLFPIFVRTRFKIITSLILIMAIGSMSRSSWLAIALTTPPSFWKKYKIPISAGVIFFFPFIYDKILAGVSSSGRFFIWKNSINLIPVFVGKGAATFISYFPQQLTSQAWSTPITVDRPHNMYLQIAHATGALSLIPLSIIIYKIVITKNPLKWGVISFLICGFFTDSMVGVTPIFVILCGLIYFGNREGSWVLNCELTRRASKTYRKILCLSYVKKGRVLFGNISRKLS